MSQRLPIYREDPVDCCEKYFGLQSPFCLSKTNYV